MSRRLSSSTNSPQTIRLRSRVTAETDLDPRSLVLLDGRVDARWNKVESLETLPYHDHDLIAPEPVEAARCQATQHETPPRTTVVPTVRLDELIQTQAITPMALDLPPDAFRRPDPRNELQVRLLRAFDLVVALLALVLTAPIMVLVALAVLADSGGPVLYASQRVGRHKPMFDAWKFRSMRPDADDALARLLASDPAARREYDAYHKLRRDPRLTRVGGFIRRTSLDELPQLWNVLRGDMSIVGPRPKLPVDAACYGPALDTVLSVRPGLTGLWQVSGRNNLTIRERVVLDLHYVHHRNFRGDLWICLRTAVILCRPGRHGAY